MQYQPVTQQSIQMMPTYSAQQGAPQQSMYQQQVAAQTGQIQPTMQAMPVMIPQGQYKHY